MRLLESAIAIKEFSADYKTMKREELEDFYESKCEFYQKYVGLTLVIASLSSLVYIIWDYYINGSFIPTLIPRLSILPVLAIYILVLRVKRSRSFVVYMDYVMGHTIMLTLIWALYNLSDRRGASECFIIMNLIWLAIGFVAKPQEFIASEILFFAEIIVSHFINLYSNLDVIIGFQIPCALAVIGSHLLLMFFYLEHYRMRQQLELAKITDPLTQVYNRHLLEKIVAKNTIRDVKQDEHIALAMLDIDNFKKINDEYGHYTGDLTLLYIGQKLSKETHDDDYVIRYGGEEFVVIFRNCDVNNACARMEQFRRDVEDAKDTPVPFTISVGVSRYTGDYSKTVQNVDNALYKAKTTGRNKVVVF